MAHGMIRLWNLFWRTEWKDKKKGRERFRKYTGCDAYSIKTEENINSHDEKRKQRTMMKISLRIMDRIFPNLKNVFANVF